MIDVRKKRLWTVRDFAEFMGISARQARALLKSLDAELGGMLLRVSGGKKPEYTFFPALLAKAKPEIFERIESLESRVADIEEELGGFRLREKRIVSQVGQNSRDIAKMHRRPRRLERNRPPRIAPNRPSEALSGPRV